MLHPFVPIYITWRWWPTIHILPLVTKMKWTGWVRIGLGELLHYIIKLCYITAAGGSWVEQLNCDNGRWDLKSGSSVALPAVNGNRINWWFVIGVSLHLSLCDLHLLQMKDFCIWLRNQIFCILFGGLFLADWLPDRMQRFAQAALNPTYLPLCTCTRGV